MDRALGDFAAAEDRVFAPERGAFDRVTLRPGTLAAGPPETATKILGRTWAAPFALAPFAGRLRSHPQGEIVMAQAASTAGYPVVVSAAAWPFDRLPSVDEAPFWLQLHAFEDRTATRRLVERAEETGFEALVLRGEADAPPDISDLVTWLRSVCSLPVLVAGVRTVPGAVRAVEAGVDGIVVGGGGGAATLGALPGIAAAVAGRCPVLHHAGAARGTDVLASLASGADAVLLGRPVLNGLAVGRREGVAEVLDLLAGELREAMTRTGTASVAEAGPGVVLTRGHRAERGLAKEDLHASVASPLLDTMNFLNEITMRYPDAISFAPGRPYDGFFDNEQIFTHIRRYLDHLAGQGQSPQDIRTAMYQYGPTAGQIRDVLADSLRVDENIDVPPGSIVVTVGAQEAMLLTLRALARGPDDVILVSSPCYMGIKGAACLLDIAVTEVEEHADGIFCADIEAAILAERARGRRPRAFYVVPDHSNPSGTTMDVPTRHALLDLAARHDILVIEDTPYRLVSPGPPLPTLKSLDRDRDVVHVGSFSKTVFPGARVGFVIADQRVVDADGRTSLLADELAKIKSMVTVNTSSLSQAAVAGVLLGAHGRLSEFNTEAAAYYGRTMRSTLEHLDRRIPAERREALGVRWNQPSGGFFLTLEVPFAADNAALSRSAQDFGVIWTPMAYFSRPGAGLRGIRLSTSYLTDAEISEGTARLARFIEAESGR